MSKATKTRPSTKSLAAIDPVGKYGSRLVVIQGLVSPSSQCAWPGTGKGDYKHCFKLAGWRELGGPLTTRELYVQRKVRGNREWPGVFKQFTVHRMEVLLSKDRTRAVFVRRKRMTKPDHELVEFSIQLIRPVVLSTEELGDFTLDRSLNWFEGKAHWKGEEVNVTLPGPQSVLLEDDFELPELENPFQTVLKIVRAQKTWDRDCKQLAVKDLLAIKNKHWLAEGEAALYATEFASRMKLTSIHVEADGRVELWFDADEMFTDHAILVRATLEDGPTDAGIEG